MNCSQWEKKFTSLKTNLLTANVVLIKTKDHLNNFWPVSFTFYSTEFNIPVQITERPNFYFRQKCIVKPKSSICGLQTLKQTTCQLYNLILVNRQNPNPK